MAFDFWKPGPRATGRRAVTASRPCISVVAGCGGSGIGTRPQSGLGNADVTADATFTVDPSCFAGATRSTGAVTRSPESSRTSAAGLFPILHQRRGKPGYSDQRGHRPGRSPAAADGQLPGQAGCPRQSDRIHLRAALQQGVRHQLQGAPRPRLRSRRWHHRKVPQDGQAQQPSLGDPRRTRLRFRRHHSPAGYNGLRRFRGRRHRRRQDGVQQQHGDGLRARGLTLIADSVVKRASLQCGQAWGRATSPLPVIWICRINN